MPVVTANHRSSVSSRSTWAPECSIRHPSLHSSSHWPIGRVAHCHAVFLPPASLALPSGPDRTDFGHPRLQNRKRVGDRNPLLIRHGWTRRQLHTYMVGRAARTACLSWP